MSTVAELYQSILSEPIPEDFSQNPIKPLRMNKYMEAFRLAHELVGLTTNSPNGKRPGLRDETGELQLGMRVNKSGTYRRGYFIISGLVDCPQMEGFLAADNSLQVKAARIFVPENIVTYPNEIALVQGAAGHVQSFVYNKVWHGELVQVDMIRPRITLC
jgi:hypothetical protein